MKLELLINFGDRFACRNVIGRSNSENYKFMCCKNGFKFWKLMIYNLRVYVLEKLGKSDETCDLVTFRMNYSLKTR